MIRRLRLTFAAALVAMLALGSSPLAPDRTAAALTCQIVPCYTLTIVLSGGATGKVQTYDPSTGVPDGAIDCEEVNGTTTVDNCSETYLDLSVGQTGVAVDYRWTAGSGSCRVFASTDCREGTGTDSFLLTKSVSYTVSFALESMRLTVTMSGDGNGSFTTYADKSLTTPDGKIDCRLVDGLVTSDSRCAYTYPDTFFTGNVTVYFREGVGADSFTCDTPDASNCDTGGFSGPLSLTSDQTEALFLPLQRQPVAVAVAGSGRVTSSPAGISCGDGALTCKSTFPFGQALQLTAHADPGATFTKWSGACAGQGSPCKLSPLAAVATTAEFTAAATPTPVPTARPTVAPTSTPAAATPSATAAAAATPTEPNSGSSPSAGVPAASGPSFGPGSAPTSGENDGSPTADEPTPDTTSGAVAAAATTGGSDPTPIVLAIVLGAVLIAAAIVAFGLLIRRRPRPTDLS